MDFSEKNILDIFKKKGYKFFTSKFSVNVYGIRMETGSDKFDDYICVAYYDADGCFMNHIFNATTDPGHHWLKNPMRKEGCAIMVAGQYRGAYKLGRHGRSNGGKGYEAGRQFKAIPVYRDANKDSKLDCLDDTIDEGIHYTNIHHGWSAPKVGKNSAGCQVIQSKTKFNNDFLPLLKKSIKMYGESFTYTLFDKKDFA